MNYIKKKIAPWEIKYGQIALTGKDFEIAKNIFQNYLGKTFLLNTFKGSYQNRHFLLEEKNKKLRLACKSFFSQLEDGETIYLKPIKSNNIGIYRDKPSEKISEKEIKKKIKDLPSKTEKKITNLLVDLVMENKSLREENNDLIKYKDRIEKYQKLDYIFEDEKYMEDWLERNIHKAIPNLEIIDRQPIVTWKESFMRNKLDFFCLDKTTRELVIVENKVRGRHRKVETQIMTYTSWAKRNINEINKKYKDKNLKATNKFKFVIITDTTDEKLEAICEDFDVALVCIDGGIIIEEIVPYYYQ